jgi:diaminopimelate decarboxylase
VKANSNIALLRMFAKEGSGFDIVSGGELFRALKAGGEPKKIVFSGVSKKKDEISTRSSPAFSCSMSNPSTSLPR